MVVQPPMADSEYIDSIQKLRTLRVAELKAIARSIGLALSGRKADIQLRIEQYYNNGSRSNDNVRLVTIRTLILKAYHNQEIPAYQPLYLSIQNNSYAAGASNQYTSSSAAVERGKIAQTNEPAHRPWLYFKESPFYRLKRLIHGSPVLASKAPETRGQCKLQFVLNESEAGLLKSSPSLKLFLLSGVYNGPTNNSDIFVQFPQPLEIHFNGVLMKDNVRGIKNRPGTARPANLTDLVRPLPQLNTLDMIYAFSKENYLVYCYIVEVISVERVLQTKVLSSPLIVKEATLKEVRSIFHKDEEDEDDDLIEVSSTLSLKCPLSFARMKYPCKSVYCEHLQCFDALAYLQLQEQASTWSCPVCSRAAVADDLSLCEYLIEVLKETGDEDEAIELFEDGSWKVHEDEDKRRDKSEEVQKGDIETIEPKKEGTPSKANDVEVIELGSESESEGDDDEMELDFLNFVEEVGPSDGEEVVPETAQPKLSPSAVSENAPQNAVSKDSVPRHSLVQNGVSQKNSDTRHDVLQTSNGTNTVESTKENDHPPQTHEPTPLASSVPQKRLAPSNDMTRPESATKHPPANGGTQHEGGLSHPNHLPPHSSHPSHPPRHSSHPPHISSPRIPSPHITSPHIPPPNQPAPNLRGQVDKVINHSPQENQPVESLFRRETFPRANPDTASARQRMAQLRRQNSISVMQSAANGFRMANVVSGTPHMSQPVIHPTHHPTHQPPVHTISQPSHSNQTHAPLNQPVQSSFSQPPSFALPAWSHNQLLRSTHESSSPIMASAPLFKSNTTPEKQNEQGKNLLGIPMNVGSAITGEAQPLNSNGGRITTPTNVNILDVFQNHNPSASH